MQKNGSRESKYRIKRELLLQLLFATLAFALMAVSSILFVRNMQKTHLSNDAEAVLAQTKIRIESELLEAQTALNIVSNTVRGMILRGESAESVYDYLAYIHAEMDSKLLGFIYDGFFTYFEVFGGEFFHSGGWEDDDFEPTFRPWYDVGVNADNQVAVTPIYFSTRTNQYDITYVQRLFDTEGLPLGMVCLNVPLHRISEYIITMQITEGGFGVLLDDAATIILHPNPDYISKPASQASPGFSLIAQELELGTDLFEQEFENYRGQRSIASALRIDNGWVLILVTPKAAYYQSMQNMMYFIGFLGLFFTVVLIIILIRIDQAKNKADAQSYEKSVLLMDMERLREVDERTHIMLDATPLGCKLWDKNLNVIECNQEAVHLFDLRDKQEFLDRFFDLSPEYQPDGRLTKEKSRELVQKAFDEGYCRFEWMHQKLDGELIPAEITLVRVRHEDDFAVAGYIRDLREYNQVVAKLEAAVQEAQEASLAKSKFLATMSHEIRTPMNVILGVTESYLENDDLDSEIRDGYVKIYNSADLLLSIINDILDLSKIEAGKLEINPGKYDVLSLINDAAHMNVIRFQHKPIVFNLKVDETIPLEMLGDELRIKQILNNILSNAFKYTDTGEVTLSFTKENEDPADMANRGVTLVMMVKDTGQGMTQEQVGKLFDEYTRFNLESNRTTVGTGLGMAITRNLVYLMNGTLSVDSTFGKGTTVFIRIPQKIFGSVRIGKETADKLQNFVFRDAIHKTNAKIVRELMPYGSVLVVDDMVSNLDVAKLLLKPYQLQIDTAVSGFDAIDMIKSGKVYDIVFMDHMMPIMDGIETIKIIRSLGYNHTVIALTANAVIGQQDIFLANGFDAFMSKPIDIRQLNDSLNKFIRDKARTS